MKFNIENKIQIITDKKEDKNYNFLQIIQLKQS